MKQLEDGEYIKTWFYAFGGNVSSMGVCNKDEKKVGIWKE